MADPDTKPPGIAQSGTAPHAEPRVNIGEASLSVGLLQMPSANTMENGFTWATKSLNGIVSEFNDSGMRNVVTGGSAAARIAWSNKQALEYVVGRATTWTTQEAIPFVTERALPWVAEQATTRLTALGEEAAAKSPYAIAATAAGIGLYTDKEFHDALNAHEHVMSGIQPRHDNSNLKTIAQQMNQDIHDGKFKPVDAVTRDGHGDISDVTNPANLKNLEAYIAVKKQETDKYIHDRSQLETFPETVAQGKAFTNTGINILNTIPGVNIQKRPDQVQPFFQQQEEAARLRAATAEIHNIHAPQAQNYDLANKTPEQIHAAIEKARKNGAEEHTYTYNVTAPTAALSSHIVPTKSDEPSFIPEDVRQAYLANDRATAKNGYQNGIARTELYVKPDGTQEIITWQVAGLDLNSGKERQIAPQEAMMVAPPLKTPGQQQPQNQQLASNRTPHK